MWVYFWLRSVVVESPSTYILSLIAFILHELWIIHLLFISIDLPVNLSTTSGETLSLKSIPNKRKTSVSENQNIQCNPENPTQHKESLYITKKMMKQGDTNADFIFSFLHLQLYSIAVPHMEHRQPIIMIYTGWYSFSSQYQRKTTWKTI